MFHLLGLMMAPEAENYVVCGNFLLHVAKWHIISNVFYTQNIGDLLGLMKAPEAEKRCHFAT